MVYAVYDISNGEKGVSNTENIKKNIKECLEKLGFWPLHKYERLTICHGKKPREKEREEKRRFIKEQVGETKGIYVYRKSGDVVYVGKGNPLRYRLFSHYRESFEEVPGDTKTKRWHKFFSQKKYSGEVDIFWKEVVDEDARKVIEKMLAYVLSPEFDR